MPRRPGTAGPLARLVKSADFQRVLGVRRSATTAHFAVHHLAAQPAPVARLGGSTGADKLSTKLGPLGELPVEDSRDTSLALTNSWVGVVVPKRHARRAVTRSLIKRQIYAVAERHRDRLGPGLWIVRLRAPFDRTLFASAASRALRDGARRELEALLEAAVTAAPSP